MTAYERGARVRYADGSATTSDGMVLAEGVVNGDPVSNGVLTYVPVWSERDSGREPTTIYVDSRNIVEVGG